MKKLLKFSPIGGTVFAPISFPSESGSVTFPLIGSEIEIDEKQYKELLKDAEFKSCIDAKQVIVFDVKSAPKNEEVKDVIERLDEVIENSETTNKKAK